MSVTVITASLPTRGAMLAEAVASVTAQSQPPAAHLVAIDHAREGSSAIRNRLLRAVETRWVAVLDDDDLLLPHHLAVLLSAGAEADVVYSRPEVRGRTGWTPAGPFDPDRLRRESYIPATALIRRVMLDAVGGWRHSRDCEHGWEDWDLWRRLLDAGARFAFVDDRTWVYRFHGGNKTDRGEARAA